MFYLHSRPYITDDVLGYGSEYLSPSSAYPCTMCLTRTRTRVDKVNAELVTLTYGTMVAQLCSDLDSNYAEVNKQLDKMGYNIGMRLVEDFFAKSGTQRCANLRETAETISKVRTRLCWLGTLEQEMNLWASELSDRQIGFKIFLNITPIVTNWTADNKQFSLIFEENPLADFVELPDDGRAQDELWYSNILCGILRGALEMVRINILLCTMLFTHLYMKGPNAS